MSNPLPDAVTLVEEFCRSRFSGESGIRVARVGLGISDLPWSCLPDITHLRQSSRRLADKGDGLLITENIVQSAQLALSTFIHHCHRIRIRLTSRNGLNFTGLSRMARICLILEILGRRELFECFIVAEIFDTSLPLSQSRLEQVLGENRTHEDVELFLAEQYRAYPRNWEEGEHLKLERREPLPFRHCRSLGHGGQGSVDEIESVLSQQTFARKVWSNINRQAEQRFFDERVLLKRLDPTYHIIQITGTYTRGRELGLIHLPVAQCDLWEALSLPEVQRRSVLPDHALRQALGCLSVGLAHMHQHGIRHKDIKPHNILINEQRFVYTDFGLSKDISDLSNSITGGGRGTAKYRAPELAHYDMEAHQAPADVFALGCVLSEIYSVLRGWAVDDEQSFSRLAPFHEHLAEVHSWFAKIEQYNDDAEGESESKDLDPELSFDERDGIWLEVCWSMLQEDPNDRPRMQDVIAVLIGDTPELHCCESCLQLLYGFLGSEPDQAMQIGIVSEDEVDVEGAGENYPEAAQSPVLPIIYQDCFFRRFRFPYNLCKHWTVINHILLLTSSINWLNRKR